MRFETVLKLASRQSASASDSMIDNMSKYSTTAAANESSNRLHLLCKKFTSNTEIKLENGSLIRENEILRSKSESLSHKLLEYEKQINNLRSEVESERARREKSMRDNDKFAADNSAFQKYLQSVQSNSHIANQNQSNVQVLIFLQPATPATTLPNPWPRTLLLATSAAPTLQPSHDMIATLLFSLSACPGPSLCSRSCKLNSANFTTNTTKLSMLLK